MQKCGYQPINGLNFKQLLTSVGAVYELCELVLSCILD